MEKINSIIKKLTKEELLELKNNLDEGTIKNFIEKRLETFKNFNKVCPVCNTPVDDEGLTLIFGSSTMRQKATFDGQDCLEYFLYKLKK